jgi:hypothetical protein
VFDKPLFPIPTPPATYRRRSNALDISAAKELLAMQLVAAVATATDTIWRGKFMTRNWDFYRV